MIIGLCGKSGSGKSSLAKEIININNNTIHVDIDKIGHDVLKIDKVKEDLKNTFGDIVINNNTVNRKELSKIVFDNKDEMDKLTNITWKYMDSEINNIINSNKDKNIILDWILLPKVKYFNMCDIKILLDISYEERLKRASIRDNISEDIFKLREKATYNYNLEDFDYIFKDNDNIKERLEEIL